MTDDSGQKTDDRGRLQKTSIANFELKAVEMNLELPDKVTLIEVGPRDGFQFEKLFIPTDLKVEIISNLVDAGLKQIQVTSFVHPAKVPQMADAEELVRRLPEIADVIYSGLVLNTRGVARAQRAGLTHVEVSISASDTHGRKNTGMSFDRAVAQLEEMVGLAQKADLNIRAGIQCAFGCAYEGEISHTRVLNIARNYVSYGVDAIALSDTTGMADPVRVTKLIELLLPEIGEIPLILHFHDTRGLGLANVLAALQCGITHFDTALAGMGGCPFVPGAAGNIATEDTASLMASMGILTGIDISRIIPSSLHLEEQLNKKFPGKIHRLPPLIRSSRN
jgi:hydroxymethylglutaryl-CoA lyase